MVMALLFVPLPLGPNSIKTYMEYSLKYFSGGVSILICYFGTLWWQSKGYRPATRYSPPYRVGGGQWLQMTGAILICLLSNILHQSTYIALCQTACLSIPTNHQSVPKLDEANPLTDWFVVLKLLWLMCCVQTYCIFCSIFFCMSSDCNCSMVSSDRPSWSDWNKKSNMKLWS